MYLRYDRKMKNIKCCPGEAGAEAEWRGKRRGKQRQNTSPSTYDLGKGPPLQTVETKCLKDE